MLIRIPQALPLLLLYLLIHLHPTTAALASNPGDFNVVTCGDNKGKTPDCTARISNREANAYRTIRMRLNLFIRDRLELEKSPLGLNGRDGLPGAEEVGSAEAAWQSRDGGREMSGQANVFPVHSAVGGVPNLDRARMGIGRAEDDQRRSRRRSTGRSERNAGGIGWVGDGRHARHEVAQFEP